MHAIAIDCCSGPLSHLSHFPAQLLHLADVLGGQKEDSLNDLLAIIQVGLGGC